ncbi:spermidine synthase [Plantactinospora sp. B6F1]|uniref:spermidine synthase n=1 Tax=Plantactinospora sp. B6F1 TaxID=3158971 RepID=UPI0032D91C6B
MSARFEEIDRRDTPIGTISLRRRLEPSLRIDVYEVKLGDEFLMSSLFPVAEIELARLGLARVSGTGLDVVVGGLGLGYTARAALADPRVRSLTVVERLGAVIEWHREGLLPHAAELTADPRTRLVCGDFFAMANGAGFDPDAPGRRFDAVLLDVDHTPRQVLHPSHAAFYRREGLRRLTDHLLPGGAFALWSNDPPDEEFTRTLAEVFTRPVAQVVRFHNHLQDREATNTVYLAEWAAPPGPDRHQRTGSGPEQGAGQGNQRSDQQGAAGPDTGHRTHRQ